MLGTKENVGYIVFFVKGLLSKREKHVGSQLERDKRKMKISAQN